MIDEVFVSRWCKSDVGNIQELFSEDNIIAITSILVYPVYLDSNVMGGRTGEAVDGIFQKVVYLPTYAEKQLLQNFLLKVDIVYLCSLTIQQVLF